MEICAAFKSVNSDGGISVCTTHQIYVTSCKGVRKSGLFAHYKGLWVQFTEHYTHCVEKFMETHYNEFVAGNVKK